MCSFTFRLIVFLDVSYAANRTFPLIIEPDVQPNATGEKNGAGEVVGFFYQYGVHQSDKNQIKDPPVSLVIHSEVEAEDLSAVIMKIVCMTYSKPIRCLSSSIDLFRYFSKSCWCRLCSICHDGLVDLGSQASPQTWVTLHRLLESISVIRVDFFGSRASFSLIIHYAILARANAGPSEGSSLVDEILLQLVTDLSLPPVPVTYVLRVAEVLRDEEWVDPNGHSLRVRLHPPYSNLSLNPSVGPSLRIPIEISSRELALGISGSEGHTEATKSAKSPAI